MVELDMSDFSDNDYGIIGNHILNDKNLHGKAILSWSQVHQMALNLTANEVICFPEKYLYENDAYVLFGNFYELLSKAGNGYGYGAVVKVYSHVLDKQMMRKKENDKLESR